MPPRRRLPIFPSRRALAIRTAIVVLLVGTLSPRATIAQSVRRTVVDHVGVQMPRLLRIHRVSAPRVRARRGQRVELTTSLTVTSNVPYRVVVTRASATRDTSGRAPRVWVRDAAGAWRPLAPGGEVAVVDGGRPGRSQPEVAWYVESADGTRVSDASVPLTYVARPSADDER